jgi:hypothetical protein
MIKHEKHDPYNFDYIFDWIDYTLNKIDKKEFKYCDLIKETLIKQKNIKPDRKMVDEFSYIQSWLSKNNIAVAPYPLYKKLKKLDIRVD